MSIEDLRKGKSAEYFVFSELIKGGADVYLPAVDIGIDAIVRREDGTYLEIQVKSTKKKTKLGISMSMTSTNTPKTNSL